VGVHQDGLVHVSAMSHSFVSDPHDVVKNGEIVKVKVLDVDVPRNRISLSLRLDDEPGQERDKASAKNAGSGARGGGERRGGRSHGGRGGQGRNGGRGGRGNRGGHGRQGNRGANNGGGGSMAEALRRAGFGK